MVTESVEAEDTDFIYTSLPTEWVMSGCIFEEEHVRLYSWVSMSDHGYADIKLNFDAVV